jgi:hypothetical protein
VVKSALRSNRQCCAVGAESEVRDKLVVGISVGVSI